VNLVAPVLEIEVPGFYVDVAEVEFCDEHDIPIVDMVTEEWMRRDVGLTFVTVPGEKNLNSEFGVVAMNGRIIGARIEDKS
jgi:hypothetical protein